MHTHTHARVHTHANIRYSLTNLFTVGQKVDSLCSCKHVLGLRGPLICCVVRFVHGLPLEFEMGLLFIKECGSTLYVGMAQGISFSLYIGIEAKFKITQKTGKRRLHTADYRTVLL